MADSTRLQEVKSKISIPMYFYNVIVPQRAEYYSDYGVDFDVKPVAKCPIHDEDTPSMRFYEETNTFYCFGCRAGGDVIALHRAFTKRMSDTTPSFDESVNFLYDFFIQGNETAKAIKTTTKLNEGEELSTQVEIVRFIGYTNSLESQLSVDTHLDDRSKQDIWRALDNTSLLVTKNEINATEAMEYIKSIVRQVVK